MNIINLTPHQINIFDKNKEKVDTIYPVGLARCEVTKEKTGELFGVPLFVTVFGEVTGLPEKNEDVIIIVSLLVRQALPDRDDLYSPGELIRDDQGQPIGCIGLTR